jgi:hypothetical protein
MSPPSFISLLTAVRCGSQTLSLLWSASVGVFCVDVFKLRASFGCISTMSSRLTVGRAAALISLINRSSYVRQDVCLTKLLAQCCLLVDEMCMAREHIYHSCYHVVFIGNAVNYARPVANTGTRTILSCALCTFAQAVRVCCQAGLTVMRYTVSTRTF